MAERDPRLTPGKYHMERMTPLPLAQAGWPTGLAQARAASVRVCRLKPTAGGRRPSCREFIARRLRGLWSDVSASTEGVLTPDESQSLYQGRIFDVQAHAIQPSTLRSTSDLISTAAWLEDGTKRIIADDVLATAADDLHGPRRLRTLRDDGIQVVTVNLGFPRADPERLLQIVDETNRWMARQSAENPQLLGTAIMPPAPLLATPDEPRHGGLIDAALEATSTAITQLGLHGIMASAHYDGVFLGDPVYEPFFGLAESLQVPVIIHPAITASDVQLVPRKNIPTDAGFLNDQRTTLLDLVKAGVLERHPELALIATHLGGGILTSLGRFEQLDLRFPDENWYLDSAGTRRRLNRLGSYFRRIHYDCNNSSRADILHAVECVGSDRLLTGTDFPWATDHHTRQVLGGLEHDLARKIAYDNARRLFAFAQDDND
ncbi:MAG: amidohydrolase family protein [Microbacterium sp.]